MWRVTYDRHHKYLLKKTSVFETKYEILATVVFLWWRFCYFMTDYPVKQVSIYREENGIPFLKGGSSLSENKEQLAKLKREKKRQF